MEIWKEWKPGVLVSNLGNIKGRKPWKDDGYLIIRYNKRKYRVHRIIAEVFIPNKDNKPEVDHINHIRDDNRVENLRWATDKEQCQNRNTNTSAALEARRNIYIRDDGLIVYKVEEYEREHNIRKGAIRHAANPNDRYHKYADGHKWEIYHV